MKHSSRHGSKRSSFIFPTKQKMAHVKRNKQIIIVIFRTSGRFTLYKKISGPMIWIESCQDLMEMISSRCKGLETEMSLAYLRHRLVMVECYTGGQIWVQEKRQRSTHKRALWTQVKSLGFKIGMVARGCSPCHLGGWGHLGPVQHNKILSMGGGGISFVLGSRTSLENSKTVELSTQCPQSLLVLATFLFAETTYQELKVKGGKIALAHSLYRFQPIIAGPRQW